MSAQKRRQRITSSVSAVSRPVYLQQTGRVISGGGLDSCPEIALPVFVRIDIALVNNILINILKLLAASPVVRHLPDLALQAFDEQRIDVPAQLYLIRLAGENHELNRVFPAFPLPDDLSEGDLVRQFERKIARLGYKGQIF